MDILIVRELTGGIYFGDRGTYEENGVVGAYDTERYTYPEIKRIVKAGFEYAMKRDKRLTCVDKANVLDSSRLWRKIVEETKADYPRWRCPICMWITALCSWCAIPTSLM